MQLVKPLPFREAVEKIGDKTPIGGDLTSGEWSDVPAALRERAFFSSRVESIRFLQRGRDAIADWLQSSREELPKGKTALAVGSRAQFVEMMREMAMREGMGPLDPKDAGGLKDITSERRLGLIFDVQTQQAGDYGYWKQGMQPEVLEEFPAQRFIRVKDVKEPREYHTQFEGRVWLKWDPIWKRINRDFGVPWGPWGWGCGHDVEDVDRDESEQLGLIKPGDQVKPDAEHFNENLRASTQGLEPDLVGKLQEEFGDRISIEGDEMKWNAEAVGRELAVGQGPLRQHPVSDAVSLQTYGAAREQSMMAMGAIEKVHDLPAGIEPVPLKEGRGREYGKFKFLPANFGFEPSHLEVRSSGPWPVLTAVHETGHMLDLAVFGPAGMFATKLPGAMSEVMAAIDRSAAVQALRQKLANTMNAHLAQHLDYLLDPREMWARAYSQYVAVRSGYRPLRKELVKAIRAEADRQWMPGDFRGIAEAIDGLLKAEGLR